jgi:alpha-glucuronidase
VALAALVSRAAPAAAETGYAGWLRYAAIDDAAARKRDEALPASAVVWGESATLQAAQQELIRGVHGLLGRTLRADARLPAGEGAIILATLGTLAAEAPPLAAAVAADAPTGDGYLLRTVAAGDRTQLVVTGASERGVLYGVFALLRRMAAGDPVSPLDERQIPFAPVRMLDQWDNLDGTIERGYGGASIFFENGQVAADLARVRDFARLLASVGLNACSINNVNADARLLSPAMLAQVARVAGAFRPWGVRLFLSIDFSSPKKVGGLDTFDPLDPRVAAWWRSTVAAVYRAIPDFGGFVLKADSEGRAGPAAYGRTHADAANVIAAALKPHDGVIFYRGFVYDHHLDWRNLKNDRARAAYENLHPLDGRFADNAVVQIKHGPIDFQVREPVSPLFAGLEKTNQVIELQVTQEYTGQGRHVCFLVPMWKQVLDFDLRAGGASTPVKELVAGRTFRRPVGGFVGVSNVGRDPTWLGHHLAMANLYGFGRLAWNPDLSSEKIADEWTRLTFGRDPHVLRTVVDIQLRSWPAYEEYTGPLGAGTLTDVTGPHYGPAPASSEQNGWGQWHRADATAVGMDRTVATGTGYIGQYPPDVARLFETTAACPDELLLFMHHVPYTHVLHSGKTVIQHIYDAHHDGAEEVRSFVRRWEALKGRVDEQRYGEVLARLTYQAGHAQVWREAIDNWFLRLSGIPDQKGMVGRTPGRVEAESMALEGYQATDVVPWEAASVGRAVRCDGAHPWCAATFRHQGAAGWFDVAVQYFDQRGGAARFKLSLNGQLIAAWTADDNLPSAQLDAHTSTRHLVEGIALRPGDELRVEGFPDGPDVAALDYVESTPSWR